MKKISFIHAADLHLDSPMIGLQHLPIQLFNRVKESTFTAFKKITEAAIKLEVDFVILAGDLFDGEDRSLRAQSRFRMEMLKLAEKEISVYVIHGNHDHLNGSWVHLDMPENVHIFKPEVESKLHTTKSGVTVRLYGFSYPTRHVYERKIDNYQKTEGADFHIGILHGNEGAGTEHDNYAPFLVKDLQEKDFDYWALGHIHKRTILSEMPPIIYPGNIQGRNKKETGAKGFYHISLTELEPTADFIESSDIVWETIEVDASSADSLQDILFLCQSTINQCRKEGIGTFLDLTLKNILLEDVQEKRTMEAELFELLLDDEKDEHSFVWVVELTIQEKMEVDKEQLKKEANFYSELFSTIEQLEEAGIGRNSLYDHHVGKKFLSPLSMEEQKELLKKAEKLLIDLLYQQ
ncbi:metallophosphoesterase family protein [Bacillus sp. JJ1764]|uniref:metallophosphoesterase family protein n=1 Tax=Bacillus sp. JJ1764 TaxID=3122964 RepID=UPI003000B31E